jgi:hypothetical protein
MVKVRAFRTLENSIRRMGFVHVAGVDEVGRGCLAGPVVAAAVVLDPGRYVARVCSTTGSSGRRSPGRWPARSRRRSTA